MPRVTTPAAIRRRDIIDSAKDIADLQKNSHFLMAVDNATRKKMIDEKVNRSKNALEAIVKDLESLIDATSSKKVKKSKEVKDESSK